MKHFKSLLLYLKAKKCLYKTNYYLRASHENEEMFKICCGKIFIEIVKIADIIEDAERLENGERILL